MNLRGLVTAFRTLTILPVPGRDSEDFGAALPWFPAVGLVLGIVLGLAAWLWNHALNGWFEGGAVLLLVGSVFLTRGLHLDGLADWADALGGKPDRKSRLAIMKDSRLGTFGGLALGIVLIAKWVALARVLNLGSPWLIPPALLVSRSMMAEIASTLPYARRGPGTAEPFVHGASNRRRFLALGGGILFCAAWGPFGLLCFAAGWLATKLFARHCRKAFGGVTGDLLGTLNEILETGLLFLSGLPLGTPLWYTMTTSL